MVSMVRENAIKRVKLVNLIRRMCVCVSVWREIKKGKNIVIEDERSNQS